MMKNPKIMRPEIEIEYVGIKGFFYALYAVCKVGIKKTSIVQNKYTYRREIHGFDAGIGIRHYFYIIPKYKFKRVSELSED